MVNPLWSRMEGLLWTNLVHPSRLNQGKAWQLAPTDHEDMTLVENHGCAELAKTLFRSWLKFALFSHELSFLESLPPRNSRKISHPFETQFEDID